jgi:hypothetical protein
MAADSSNNDSNDRPSGPDAKHPRRPIDTAIRQQRMKAWQPILDPTYVIAALFVFGGIFLVTGLVIQNGNAQLTELKVLYDGFNNSTLPCYITDANQNRQCSLSFKVPKTLEPPIMVHYELTNFYQNHRKYVKSRDDTQLRGAGNSSTPQSNCDPLRKLGDVVLNPCGLIANTFFNDIITLETKNDDAGRTIFMNESGIAWQSDVKHKFKQPLGFVAEQCSSCDATDCNCDGDAWTCDAPYQDDSTDPPTCTRYFYPNEYPTYGNTQYLHKTYPDIINPIEGVTNQHFIVWMRTAALSNFRKLYGWINTPIEAGTVLTFNVAANWEVQSFQGTKALIVSTSGPFGGKNRYLGEMFWIIGAVFLIVAFLFSLKHIFKPRKLGDTRYLRAHVKQE